MQELDLGCGSGCPTPSKEGQKLQQWRDQPWERKRRERRREDTFYPCCTLLCSQSVICSLERQGSSQASHLSSSEPVLQSILEAGKKSLVLPGKELLSGVEQPSAAASIHPSSCLGRAISAHFCFCSEQNSGSLPPLASACAVQQRAEETAMCANSAIFPGRC